MEKRKSRISREEICRMFTELAKSLALSTNLPYVVIRGKDVRKKLGLSSPIYIHIIKEEIDKGNIKGVKYFVSGRFTRFKIERDYWVREANPT